jgi:hypothetical protein
MSTDIKLTVCHVGPILRVELGGGREGWRAGRTLVLEGGGDVA